MIALRIAGDADIDALLPRMRAYNEVERIVIADPAAHLAALRKLIAEPDLGAVWLVERDAALIGYAIVTYNFDLEFSGRDAFLTELWIDEAARGGGVGTAVLALLDTELRARDVKALSLLVYRDNPAMRLYERSGFEESPRAFMTRLMS
jgi:ribosomal protein S18 acetylase RimI-like enzyme